MTKHGKDDEVTTDVVAQMAGCTPRRVLQMINGIYKDGVCVQEPFLPARKVGRDWMVRQKHIHIAQERRRQGWPKGVKRGPRQKREPLDAVS